MILNLLISGKSMFKYRVFLDTNVLLDTLLGNTRPAYVASTSILQAAKQGLLEVFITTQSIIDASYVCSRIPGYDDESFNNAIKELLSFANIDHINVFDLYRVLEARTGDFEDEAQFQHADFLGCDALITSDKAFRSSKRETEMLFFSPEEFLARMSELR